MEELQKILITPRAFRLIPASLFSLYLVKIGLENPSMRIILLIPAFIIYESISSLKASWQMSQLLKTRTKNEASCLTPVMSEEQSKFQGISRRLVTFKSYLNTYETFIESAINFYEKNGKDPRRLVKLKNALPRMQDVIDREIDALKK